MSGVYLGAGRDCRYSGARRGIGASGAIGAPRGGGCWGLLQDQGCRECIGVASGLGAQPHWAPVWAPSTPTGSPGGVTYLVKAKQVTEMSSAGYYIHLELYFMTVFTSVSMPPHHIFLQYKEMLYGLFSLQTNLHISLHHQSDVL